MASSLSAVLRRTAWGARLVGGKYLVRKGGFAETTGWLASVRASRPVDDQGRPIPWYTYACLRFIEPRLPTDLAVFEYGAGNSTLWWLQRSRQLISIEHNPEWFGLLAPGLAGTSATLLLREDVNDGSYTNAVAEFPVAFDVVVVDGRNRVACALNAAAHLSDRGVIIWDDADRPRYEGGLHELASRGFRRIDFHGLAPVSPRARSTAILYRPANCLGI